MASENEKVALYATGSGILLLMTIMFGFSVWLSNMEQAGALPASAGWLAIVDAGEVPNTLVTFAQDLSSALTRYEAGLARLGGLLIEYERNPSVGYDPAWVVELRGVSYNLDTIGFYIRHLSPPDGMDGLHRRLLKVDRGITRVVDSILSGPRDRFTADLSPIVAHLVRAADSMQEFDQLLSSRDWTATPAPTAVDRPRSIGRAEQTAVTQAATITPTLGPLLSSSGRIFPTPTPTALTYRVTNWVGGSEVRCELGPADAYTVHNRAQTQGVEYLLVSTADGCKGRMQSPD